MSSPKQPADPTKDKRILVNHYAVAVSPSDGAVWGTEGRLSRAHRAVVPGADPSGDRAHRKL